MDNLDPNEGNQDPQGTPEPQPQPAPQPAPEPQSFSWKGNIGEDLSKAPGLGKFEDTKEGLAELGKSYVNLEKLLSHEKVPLPKGPDDAEGRAAFNKAIGVPDTAEGYHLPDAKMMGSLEEAAFDKGTFQQYMHKHGLTPAQANGLWQDYVQMSNDMYNQINQEFTNKMDENVNALRKSWGDAYAGNVELGDMVINKFSDDKAMADFLTANLAKDPAGMKFLAKIGTHFAENKIGDFQYKRFAMTAEEAKNEVAKIKADPNHPYSNPNATEDDHNAAVEHVNRLIGISLGKQQI